MVEFLICVVLFLAITFFPFTLSRRIEFHEDGGASLYVRNDNIKDPRYFVKSFKRMLNKAIKENGDGSREIVLSKKEKIVYIDSLNEIQNTMNSLCYMKKKIQMDRGIRFNKEIFAEDDIQFSEHTFVRAVAGEKKVFIGENSKIVRWADAEELLVLKSGTNAGRSCSSPKKVVIEPGCRFSNVFSPVIEMRNYIQVLDEVPNDVAVQKSAPVYIKIIRNIKRVEDDEIMKRTIVTKHSLTIGAGAIVYGDVKTSKRLRIKKNAVITGNVFADDSIIMETGVKVMGNVFTSESLYMACSCQIGRMGRIKSAIAREHLIIGAGSVIYGYVATDKKGRVVSEHEFEQIVNSRENIDVSRNKGYYKAEIKKFDYIKANVNSAGSLRFKDMDEYVGADYYALRNNTKIVKVHIPHGAEVIYESMFYGCSEMTTVYIPSSVKVIEDGAFSGCEKLHEVIIEDGSRLEEIGRYAFAECKSLKHINIQRTIRFGTGAFRNCENLQTVSRTTAKTIIDCGTHVFQNCKKLQNVDFISSLKVIPFSCFYNCKSLNQLVINDGVSEVEDYAFYGCERLDVIELENPDVILHENSFGGIPDVLFKDIYGNEISIDRKD